MAKGSTISRSLEELRETRGVQVWIANSDAAPDALKTSGEMLSTEERNRASRFRFDRHRLNYVFAQVTLRQILGRYLSIEPHEVAFEVDEFGKPFLKQKHATLSFNMSHSETVVVVAATVRTLIGVDVEFVRPIEDLDSIAQDNFTPRERQILDAVDPGRKLRRFFTCWTRKEAYVKAVGKGLSIPLDSFDTSSALEGWSLCDLTLPDGYVGSIVTNGSDVPKITYLR